MRTTQIRKNFTAVKNHKRHHGPWGLHRVNPPRRFEATWATLVVQDIRTMNGTLATIARYLDQREPRRWRRKPPLAVITEEEEYSSPCKETITSHGHNEDQLKKTLLHSRPTSGKQHIAETRTKLWGLIQLPDLGTKTYWFTPLKLRSMLSHGHVTPWREQKNQNPNLRTSQPLLSVENPNPRSLLQPSVLFFFELTSVFFRS